MPTQKIDPIKEFATLRDTVSRAIGQGIQSFTGGIYPLLDIYETETSVVIRTSPIDGLVPDSIEVSMEEDLLTITGETKSADDVPQNAYLQRERRFGAFSRAVRIPHPVNAEVAQAKFNGGILTITLPKIEGPGPQTIDVTPEEG
jgi:HSP20 family protein